MQSRFVSPPYSSLLLPSPSQMESAPNMKLPRWTAISTPRIILISERLQAGR